MAILPSHFPQLGSRRSKEITYLDYHVKLYSTINFQTVQAFDLVIVKVVKKKKTHLSAKKKTLLKKITN